jgi:glyoxylase-like metal-dependent hydrolase (beta-lactamase superfamily II)
MPAKLDILFSGYVGERVAGTVSLIRSDDAVIVVDPGMVPDRAVILEPLRGLGIEPSQVSDVILSHHHPDHTMNIALFPAARVHDHWAIYERDVWTSRPAEGFEVAPGVVLAETPGHTPQDITTLVEMSSGTAALTHLWWSRGAVDDPLAWDASLLHRNRERILSLATLIVPGHGEPFPVGDDVPR